jgi:predicted transcriptional regulator
MVKLALSIFKEATKKDLAWCTKLSNAQLSKSLKLLASSGIVEVKKDGVDYVYKLAV